MRGRLSNPIPTIDMQSRLINKEELGIEANTLIVYDPLATMVPFISLIEVLPNASIFKTPRDKQIQIRTLLNHEPYFRRHG